MEEKPTPTQVAVLDADVQDGSDEPPDAKSAGAEQGEKSNTVLYVIIAVLGAIILAGAVGITIVMRKMKVKK